MKTEKGQYNRLETAFLRKDSLQGWPLDGIRKFRFREGCHHSLTAKSSSHGTNCMYNVVYAEHLLSFREPGILVHARQRVSMWPGSNKNSGYSGSGELSQWPHFTRVVKFIAGGIKFVLRDFQGHFLDTCGWFPVDFTSGTFFPLMI